MSEEKPPQPPKQDWADFVETNRKWRGAFIGLTVILILAAAGGGYLFEHKNKSKTSTKTTTMVRTAPTKIAVQTKTYTSPNFYLTFSYPQDWTLTDSGGGTMTVVSPPIGLTSSSGQKVTGQITLTVRSNGQPLPEFDKGNAAATVESTKIAYTNPSQTQRASTYLSFLTYAGSKGSGLDGVYITGDTGYKAAQAIPKADFVPVDPIVSITFTKCNDSKCSGKGTPLNLGFSDWRNPALSQPLTKMLESLAFT